MYGLEAVLTERNVGGREKVLKEKVPQIRRFRLVFAGIIRVLGFNSRVDFIFSVFFLQRFVVFYY